MEESSNMDYNKDQDFRDSAQLGVENFFNQDIECLINEEMPEPFISHWCREDNRANELIKHCTSMFHKKDWEKMIKTLSSTTIPNSASELEKDHLLFVKCFYTGIALFKLQRFEEAKSSYIEASKKYQYFQLNYNIGLCYIKLEDFETALFYLEAVTRTNKNFFFAYYNLIKIYLLKNNVNEAYLIYKDFSESINKEREAEKNLEKIDIPRQARLSVSSLNSLKLFYKVGAECCFAKALYQECVHTILEALRFNPSDPELWCLYGKVFIMKKNVHFAKPLIEKALKIDPSYTEAKKLLQIVEECEF